jgi:hypothetical protein
MHAANFAKAAVLPVAGVSDGATVVVVGVVAVGAVAVVVPAT